MRTLPCTLTNSTPFRSNAVAKAREQKKYSCDDWLGRINAMSRVLHHAKSVDTAAAALRYVAYQHSRQGGWAIALHEAYESNFVHYDFIQFGK